MEQDDDVVLGSEEPWAGATDWKLKSFREGEGDEAAGPSHQWRLTAAGH